MKKVLVAYASMSGSTIEVARTVGAELASRGLNVEVSSLDTINSLDGYDALVLGAPMAMGWHRSAVRFLEQHRKELAGRPLAIFVMALSLTWSGEQQVSGTPVCVDPRLGNPPRVPGKPSLKESHCLVERYAAPIIKAAAPARPVSIGFYGGKLDYRRLSLFPKLFVKLVIGAQEGDRRDRQLIKGWAAGLFQ